MKKYNLSKIMKRAWELFKSATVENFSAALKKAWREVKMLTVMTVWNKVEEYAEFLKNKVDADFVKVIKNDWEKDNESRAYFTVRAYRKGKLKREIPCGYFNKITNEYVAEQAKGIEATNVFNF